MFSDVPNPAILLRWFIFPKLVKLWLNPGAEKTPLIWYFDLSNHIKAIFLFLFFVSAKTLLKEPKSQWWQWSPPLPFLFGQNIPCDVAQTSEDFIGPGIKLAGSLTHPTTGGAMKPLRRWFRSTTWPQDFFLILFFCFILWSVWFRAVDVCSFQLAFYLNSFPALVAVKTLSFIAPQGTEMENLPKMKRVSIFVCSRFMKYQTW